MATIQEILEKDLQRQIKFNKVEEYHKLGYKGKGIVILNSEVNDDHMYMTNEVLKDYAPESIIVNGAITSTTNNNKAEVYLTINGEKQKFEAAIDAYNIKVITTSISGKTPTAVLNYFKDIQRCKGVIFFCSAGNEGTDGVTGKYTKNDTAIAVGAAYLTEKGEIKLHNYSARGEELDFVSLLARGEGTSAASPALAAMTALLLQRYGDFNQAECVEILKSLCIDLGQPGKDPEYGWGLPVLPLTNRLEILERLRGGKMEFTDVKETDWFKDAVNHLTNIGELKGFPDGTFKPDEPMTRAQYAQARYNQLKLEGKIK